MGSKFLTLSTNSQEGDVLRRLKKDEFGGEDAEQFSARVFAVYLEYR